MNVLTGKQAVFSIRIDGVWYPVFCAMDISFQYDFEEVLTTSRDSGVFRERELRLCDWSVSASGLTKVDNSDGQISAFWLAQQGVRGTKQYMRIKYRDDAGTEKFIYGNILIKQGQLASAANGFTVASSTFPGTGPFQASDVAGFAPTSLYKLYLATTPGAHVVSHADLGGVAQILLVIREDGQFEEVAGVPVNRQFRYDDQTTSGDLVFDNTLPFSPGEVVYVEYEK